MSAMQRPAAGGLSLRSLRLFLIAALLGAAAPVARAARPVSFLPPITYDQPVAVPLAGADGVPLLIADLDGDGRQDLVVFTQEGISLLYGNGDGTLSVPMDYVLVQDQETSWGIGRRGRWGAS